MTASIIHPEPVYNCSIDLNTSMSLALIIISAFELEQKQLPNFALSFLSIFLNTKTNVVMNLSPLSLGNIFLVSL